MKINFRFCIIIFLLSSIFFNNRCFAEVSIDTTFSIRCVIWDYDYKYYFVVKGREIISLEMSFHNSGKDTVNDKIIINVDDKKNVRKLNKLSKFIRRNEKFLDPNGISFADPVYPSNNDELTYWIFYYKEKYGREFVIRYPRYSEEENILKEKLALLNEKRLNRKIKKIHNLLKKMLVTQHVN